MKQRLLGVVFVLGLFFGVMFVPVKAEVDFAIGVLGNFSDFKSDGTEYEGDATLSDGVLPGGVETTSTSVTEDIEFPSLFTEVAWRDENGYMGFTFGLEYVPSSSVIGTKSRTDTRSDATDNSDDSGTYTAKAEVEDLMTIYIEPTIYPSKWFGVYGKAGVSRVTVNSLESIAQGENDSAYGNETVYGTSWGAGIKFQPAFFLVKMEYLNTSYEAFELQSTTGNMNKIEADTGSQALRIGIGFQF